MRRIQRGLIFIAAVFSLAGSIPVSAKPIQVYGVWHCGSDLCGWDNVPEMADFDRSNHWLIDRGGGKPSVNLVVLSFVDPLRLLDLTNDAHNLDGIPIGITPEIVTYFTRHKIRVMISIGGYTYARDWDQALATNPRQLGINAAHAASGWALRLITRMTTPLTSAAWTNSLPPTAHFYRTTQQPGTQLPD
jgi:hypothetical protein